MAWMTKGLFNSLQVQDFVLSTKCPD